MTIVSSQSIDRATAAAVLPAAEPIRDNPQIRAVAHRLTAAEATQEQRDRAYDIVNAEAAKPSGPVTDDMLADTAAEAIAADRTIPVNVHEIAPLVPRGTALGPFASNDAAAVAMMDYSNPESIKANLENGGLVFRDDATGQFYVSTPIMGTLDGVNPFAVETPDGLTMVGCYHGHADYSKSDGTRTDKQGDEFNSDQFSSVDKRGADRMGIPGWADYLSTPNGSFRKYEPDTRQDTLIRDPTRNDEPQQPVGGGGRFTPVAI